MDIADLLRAHYKHISDNEIQSRLCAYTQFADNWRDTQHQTPSITDSWRYIGAPAVVPPISRTTYRALTDYAWYYKDKQGWAPVARVLTDHDMVLNMTAPEWASVAALPHYFQPWLWRALSEAGVLKWSDLPGIHVDAPSRHTFLRPALIEVLRAYGIRANTRDFRVDFESIQPNLPEIVKLREEGLALFRPAADVAYIERVYEIACRVFDGVEIYWWHGNGLAIRRGYFK